MTPHRISRAAFLLVVALALAISTAPASAQEGSSLTVQLQEYQGSGFTGTAVLTETSAGGTHVSMTLTGQETPGNHPTHIHTGTCDNFDPNPLYPLQTFNLSPVNDQGVSETDVPEVSLETLRTGDYVILVHQSPEQLTNYLVCGEISSGTLGTAPVATATETASSTHEMPTAGVGTTATTGSTLAIVLAALAVVAVAAGSALRLYRR